VEESIPTATIKDGCMLRRAGGQNPCRSTQRGICEDAPLFKSAETSNLRAEGVCACDFRGGCADLRDHRSWVVCIASLKVLVGRARLDVLFAFQGNNACPSPYETPTLTLNFCPDAEWSRHGGLPSSSCTSPMQQAPRACDPWSRCAICDRVSCPGRSGLSSCLETRVRDHCSNQLGRNLA
jgi:hypothetical protein